MFTLLQAPTQTTPAAPASTTEAIEQQARQLSAQAEAIIARLQDLGVEWGLRILGVLVVFIVAFMVARWVRRIVFRVLNRPKFDKTLATFLSNLAKWAVLTFALVSILGMVGIPTASLAAVIGAAGVAIGLALQGTLSNFAAGVMLLIFRPFNVGDAVTVAGQSGVVQEIDFLSTDINTGDNRRIIVPNGQVFGSVIINDTLNASRATGVTVTVDASLPFDQVRAALLAAAASVQPRLDTPAPAANPTDLAGGGVQWRVEIWCKTSDLLAARPVLVQRVQEAIIRAAIAGPTPGMNVNVRNLA
jgi:small conductance mechanosensitive channel